jgi:competence protein ComEA
MKRKTPLDRLVLFVSACLVAGSAFGQTRDTANETQSNTSSRKSTERRVRKPNNANLIEINSAPKLELMTLPGIGDTEAQKIIDGRPYRAKTQLVQKNVIPQATYDKIAESIFAKRSRPLRSRPRLGITGSAKETQRSSAVHFLPLRTIQPGMVLMPPEL